MHSGVAAVLASSLEWEPMLVGIANVCVDALADACIVDVPKDDGRSVKRWRVVHRDPAMREIAAALESLPLDRSLPHVTKSTIDTGATLLLRSVANGDLERLAQSAEHERLLHALAPVSLLVVPLLTHGEILGALALLSSCPERHYDDDDVALAGDIAGRVAQAMRSARLFRETQRYELEQRFLARVGRAFAESIEVAPTYAAIVRQVVPALADWCVLFVTDDAGALRVVDAMHTDEKRLGLLRDAALRYPPLERNGPLNEVLRSRRSTLIPVVPEEALRESARDEAHFEVLRRLVVTSAMVVPLIARGRLVGALTFCAGDSGRCFGEGDLWVAEELARRAALAIDNAALYAAAQRAIGAREAILGIVAHDLRTPLASIRLGVDALRRKLPEGSGPRQKAETILRSADLMARLIRDLLDLGQIEAGKLRVERTLVAPGAMLPRIAELHGAEAAEAGLTLEVMAAPSSLPFVSADADRVLQVLGNLVGNAVKYTPPGGTVRVGVEARGGEVVFSVQDSGTGLMREQLEHVFEPFWQARGDRRGVGLGLAIAKGLVAAQEGRIWAESEPDRGTTFFVAFPITARD